METVVVKKRGRKKKIVQDADKVEPSTTKCITNNMEQETRQGYDPVSLEKNTKEFTSLDQPHTAIEEERIKDNTKEVSKIQEQGLRKTAVKKRGKKKSIDELENHDDDEETSVIASKSKSDSCSKTKTKAKTKTKTKAKTKTKTKTKPTAAGISKPSIASKLCDTEQEKLDTESEVNPHRGMVENENAPAWSGVRLKDDDLLEENTQEYTDANNACAVGEMDAVEPLVTGERGHSNSVVLRGVRENLKKYPHCVLLTRVGDFYELYYNQADEIGGALLGLQVVDKKYGKADSVRFTGFPGRSLERYLELLVMKYGKSVALCNQFRVKDRPVFIRKVTRIFTPGTWMLSSSDIQSSNENNGYQNYVNSADRMDTELGEQQDVESMSAELGESLESDFDQSIRENNYFSSGHQYIICVFKNSKSSAKDVGLAWIDITTGDFVTATTNVEDLSVDMARIRPREIVVDQSAEEILVELKNIYPFSAINETYKPANIISPISGQFNREDKLQKNIHRNSMLTNTRATNCGPTITVLGSHMFDEGNYQLQDPQSSGSNLSSGTYQSLDDSELFGMQDEVSGELAGQETETRAQYEALLSSLLGNEQTGGDTDSADFYPSRETSAVATTNKIFADNECSNESIYNSCVGTSEAHRKYVCRCTRNVQGLDHSLEYVF
ncbi:MutS protein-like protein [Zancudomyces culisetae]|uniref:MutS protein-like protein n=1 Tax=Zancudomyces culisetae TaxID=1213189 RepID=A0A1R1PKV9_ZANCU|nr:MutS protein-like protein [Zancudomyces culisetae]|eukprot:OMH81577.1 MutS protein-like protein [Zancudomyces culisetae]